MAPLCCPRRNAAGVAVEGGKLVAGGRALTPQFRAIDSFDVSLDRREVVFSAKRDTNFDVGLVSLDGSEVHWVPEDPADEVDAQWAPKGPRISYVIRKPGGDLVRVVHVPTAVQLTSDFPYATIHSMAWDPAGERYSVVLSSPDASERVVSAKFDGTARKVEIAPEVRLDLDVESFGAGVMLRPSLMRYNERLPLVLWQSDHPLEWSDARGALMKEDRVAIAVVPELPDAVPDAAWLDGDRVFVVASDRPNPVLTQNGHVTVVPRGDVESSATAWLAQRLKGPNGRR